MTNLRRGKRLRRASIIRRMGSGSLYRAQAGMRVVDDLFSGERDACLTAPATLSAHSITGPTFLERSDMHYRSKEISGTPNEPRFNRG
jgi:hypothetical protein